MKDYKLKLLTQNLYILLRFIASLSLFLLTFLGFIPITNLKKEKRAKILIKVSTSLSWLVQKYQTAKIVVQTPAHAANLT